jgi:hypothetical protein
MFPSHKTLIENILLCIMKCTLEKFVLSYVNATISITTIFDLWMNKDALCTFAFVICFLTFALMFDLKFKDISILNNYVQIGKKNGMI